MLHLEAENGVHTHCLLTSLPLTSTNYFVFTIILNVMFLENLYFCDIEIPDANVRDVLQTNLATVFVDIRKITDVVNWHPMEIS